MKNLKNKKRAWIYDLLFILVLLLAGYLRLGGVKWGEGYHQHPDELAMMGWLDNLRAHTCIDPLIPVDACPPEQKRWLSVGEYFDSATSTLSPYIRGASFFPYGDLPLTLVRSAIELTGNEDIGNSKFFARQFSALADLFTIFLLYLIVSKLYGQRTGLIAAAFSALTVMQIQQSHFFTADLFANLFIFLTLYFGVGIVGQKAESGEQKEEGGKQKAEGETQNLNSAFRVPHSVLRIVRSPLFWLSIGFGFALGMAMASKINTAVLAVMLPGAFIVRYLTVDRGRQSVEESTVNGQRSAVPDYWLRVALFLIAGGLAAIISFRTFQPYAFKGLGLDPQWIANLSEVRLQATGEADLPWNLQWARRTHLYSFTNLTVWGLGLPLGILAWAGFLLMGWRILKGEYRHLLLWGWTAFYFGWQSMQFNATMRYQLPVYPLLAMMAAWFIFELAGSNVQTFKRSNVRTILPALIGTTVLALTAIWAFAFQSIYLRDETRMTASRWIYENVPGPINLQIQTEDGSVHNQPLTFPTGGYVQAGVPYSTIIVPNRDGLLTGMTFAHAQETSASPVTILLSLVSPDDPGNIFASASATLDSAASNDPRGSSLTFVFDAPVPVTADTTYSLNIETLGETLTLSGASFANETDYDWGLPFRVDGYDPFGGMYRGDLNLQVYWDDNADKLTRFMDTLNQSDYIFIPTNHQYAQITRLPERYPLTTKYYRDLLGCPDGEDIIKCYRVAQPGQYQGDLGFELAAVFESYPTLGPLVINDVAAEEAFTFYDHPKVLIFKKTADYDAAKVLARLGSVDLTNVVHLIPKQAADYKDLMLPDTRLAQQRAGGTWSQLFSYDWIQNKYPLVGIVIWYAFIFILGLLAYPLARLALPALGQYAYPLGRIVGLALLAWISWMGGSVGVPFTRVTISMAAALIAAAGIGLWMMRREQFKAEWNSNRRFFVAVEILFLVFFLIDLLIRLGNSDLWHPAKGGERPMDFSYFNAVLKSTSFPPYDPWFAGGYINYYYYGFVLAGTPVKLLGIAPSIAYNLILPTWFALIAVGAFAVGYSIVGKDKDSTFSLQPSALISGLAASAMTILLGNLGTARLIFNTLQRIAAPDQIIPVDAHILQKWGYAIKGLFMSFGGMQLPIGRGDWYWFPSRVIPAPGDVEPITEFPLFTFLYSDLHAHMLVMPITLFIIAWAVSFIKSRAQMTRAEWFATFGIGALMVGALKPTNTWDLYTYFPLAVLALAYTLYRNFEWKSRFNLPHRFGNALAALGAVALLYVLGALLYSPFTYWYSLGYGAVDPWQGSRTPMSSYLTQWGLFLFIIAAWMAWETREWMASTPVSHLGKLRNYSLPIEIGLAVVIALLAYFAVEGVRIGWLALPLAGWAGILLLRPNMPDLKRGVLMMIGTALVLTLAVEVVVLVGDIGRMNTVFKLYLQAWTLLTVSTAAAFGWLLNVAPLWRMRWHTVYQVGLYVLVIGSLLFTLTATSDKINDRMTPSAPRTLDSMEFMKDSAYADYGRDFSLNEDYYLIRWMQENIQGSPVIVEAASAGEQYRWHSRITTYTGLPDVVGWQWHQQQQRVLESNQIIQRGIEVDAFYRAPDKDAAAGFLRKYDVSYIVLGQLEYAKYTSLDPNVPDGLRKFNELNGVLWREIFRHGATILYEVLP